MQWRATASCFWRTPDLKLHSYLEWRRCALRRVSRKLRRAIRPYAFDRDSACQILARLPDAFDIYKLYIHICDRSEELLRPLDDAVSPTDPPSFAWVPFDGREVHDTTSMAASYRLGKRAAVVIADLIGIKDEYSEKILDELKRFTKWAEFIFRDAPLKLDALFSLDPDSIADLRDLLNFSIHRVLLFEGKMGSLPPDLTLLTLYRTLVE